MLRKYLAVLMFLVLAVAAGCVSMPKEAEQLSAELGVRISSARESHLAMVRHYMAEKRERVDEFMNAVWIPAFAENVFNMPKISDKWDEIVRSDDKEERLTFIRKMGPKIQIMINKERKSRMKPINEMEQLLLARINEHYDEMLAANSTLTSFIHSAVKVKEREKAALKYLDLDDKLARYTEKVEEVVGELIKGKEKIDENKDKINTIKELIGNLRDSGQGGNK
jgi:hypothetical protein